MKNNGKIVKQVAILGVLFLALIVVGIMQFRGTPATNPAPATKTDTVQAAPGQVQPNGAPLEAGKPNEKPLGWIDEARLPGIAAEAKMRNPFKSFLDKPIRVEQPRIATANNFPSVIDTATGRNTGSGPQRLPPYPEIRGENVAPLAVVPPFELVSINSDVSAKVHYAFLALNGEYYTLRAGEKVPGVDWVVKSIDPIYNQVVLAKSGSEPVTLRMSGGS